MDLINQAVRKYFELGDIDRINLAKKLDLYCSDFKNLRPDEFNKLLFVKIRDYNKLPNLYKLLGIATEEEKIRYINDTPLTC